MIDREEIIKSIFLARNKVMLSTGKKPDRVIMNAKTRNHLLRVLAMDAPYLFGPAHYERSEYEPDRVMGMEVVIDFSIPDGKCLVQVYPGGWGALTDEMIEEREMDAMEKIDVKKTIGANNGVVGITTENAWTIAAIIDRLCDERYGEFNDHADREGARILRNAATILAASPSDLDEYDDHGQILAELAAIRSSLIKMGSLLITMESKLLVPTDLQPFQTMSAEDFLQRWMDSPILNKVEYARSITRPVLLT